MAPLTTSQVKDLLPNTVYLTFNQPERDEYHRGIFITQTPKPDMANAAIISGTLFHAVFANKTWGLERREVTNITNSKSLVLMWRVGPVKGHYPTEYIEKILKKVPCRADQNADNEEEGRTDLILAGNPEMGGFSCIPWTENALRALRERGIIEVAKEIGALVREARVQAGPEDARLMVGKDFGSLRVVNDTV